MVETSLLQQLKERKLVQWALAYLAGAFVVFQLLDALSEPLGLSNTVQRAILVIVGIGFFITLILAWYHGEKGRQRVSGPELLMVAALLVVAGVALSTVGGRDGRKDPSEVPQGPVVDDDRPGVAVLPCANFSPNPEDAFRAQGIHDEILLRLQGISSLRSIGRTSVLPFAEGTETSFVSLLDT
jgi:pimeloyl-ACP methyl ester carboxylesterase